MNMNNCSFVGRLTADPEVREVNDKTVCNFTLAVPRTRSKDETDFLRFVAWGQPAKFLGQYGRKGSEVTVTGELQNNNYTDKDGNKVYRDKVVVQDLTIGFRATEKASESVSEQTSNYTPNTQKPTERRDVAELAQFEQVHFTEVPNDEEGLPF